MTKIIYKLSALILGLLFISFQTQAASATASVSANIVPQTSLYMSDHIILKERSDGLLNKAQSKLNGPNIETSSFNSNNTAKIKINSSQNVSYDISITPTSILTDNSENKMEVKSVRVLNDFDPTNNNKEQELLIEAVVKENDEGDDGFYFGTVEINVNYN